MHHNAQRHIPEDCNLHSHLHADRKAAMKKAILLLQILCDQLHYSVMWICRTNIKYSSMNGIICLRSGRGLLYRFHKGWTTAEFLTSVLDVGWE
jgi:hypothetical protein